MAPSSSTDRYVRGSQLKNNQEINQILYEVIFFSWKDKKIYILLKPSQSKLIDKDRPICL